VSAWSRRSSAHPAAAAGPRRSALFRHHDWSPQERAVVIAVLTIAMGSLFLATYTLALGDPVPHRIEAGLVGDPAQHAGTLEAVESVAEGGLAFRRYGSGTAGRHAMDLQRVYATLDLTSARPTLYVASAAGASVARVLERASATDPGLRIVDTHPLSAKDPNGLDIFYVMLVATIIGFLSVFQIRANAGGVRLRHWTAGVAGFALAAALALTLMVGPVLGRLHVPVAETWGILALHILAVASFASLMSVLIGRWAIIPTWLFFVVLGNSSSGGAVAPPLLPAPFAFVSQWLPSGATVTSLRDAIYFAGYQHARPILVLAAWAATLFAAMVAASRHGRTSPGG
jgi:hypothetical protein